MKHQPDFGIHIPGVKGLFDSCEEIIKRTKLPHSDPKHIRGGIPEVVELKQRKNGQMLGRVPWADAIRKQ